MVIFCAIHSFWRRKKPSLSHRVKFYCPKSSYKSIGVKSCVENHSTHSVLEVIGDGFSWIQDFILSASCYNGYGVNLSQLLLVLSGDVELNPGPFNEDEDISADVDTTPLDLDDLADVLTELEPVEFRYFEIGIMLHLRPYVLNGIRSLNSVSFSMRMSEIITEWLKLNYNTKRFGPPTWNALVIAVAKGPGGANEACARDIANKHRVSRVSKPVIEDPISESPNSSPFSADKILETTPANTEPYNEMASSKQEVQFFSPSITNSSQKRNNISTASPVESQVTITNSLCLQPKGKKDSMYGPTLMESIADNGTYMTLDLQCPSGAEEGSNIKDNIPCLQEHVKEGSKRRDVSQVRKLINEDVSAENDNNNTPLEKAAINMKEAMASPLNNEPFCNTNVKGALGSSLLHKACKGGHVSLVRKLINEHKADVNSRDDDNNTPLQVAALNGKEELTLALINEFGCDTNIKDNYGSFTDGSLN